MSGKTHKGASKRFWLTGSGKLRRRQSGQDHFNARAKQKITKGKRKDETVTDSNPRIIELLNH